ncbi:hypothetical protein [Actinokineospora sp. NBRC 105648]|uniref:hypothetical protein n=1 Tax=Actinokineospora sp. NBRC 105648 TaxID=3032206 RepID=UPI0024A45B35|nr:hypothetical protein [Actinokineospora sp. NBRC 105648]GLZ38414.1 hypothetical protein Acsp05_20380 [Actinokineospora sp. NBRC 105648]
MRALAVVLVALALLGAPLPGHAHARCAPVEESAEYALRAVNSPVIEQDLDNTVDLVPPSGSETPCHGRFLAATGPRPIPAEVPGAAWAARGPPRRD